MFSFGLPLQRELKVPVGLIVGAVGGTLRGDKALVPVITVRDGEVFSADWGPRPWGWLPDSAS